MQPIGAVRLLLLASASQPSRLAGCFQPEPARQFNEEESLMLLQISKSPFREEVE